MNDEAPGVVVFDARCNQPIAEAATADELWRVMKQLRSRGCYACGWEIELLMVDVEDLSGDGRGPAADELRVSGLPSDDVQRERCAVRVLPLLRLRDRTEAVRAPAHLRDARPKSARGQEPVVLLGDRLPARGDRPARRQADLRARPTMLGATRPLALVPRPEAPSTEAVRKAPAGPP
jgi:hypothetical protein